MYISTLTPSNLKEKNKTKQETKSKPWCQNHSEAAARGQGHLEPSVLIRPTGPGRSPRQMRPDQLSPAAPGPRGLEFGPQGSGEE